jgi:hypothetical protein
MRSAGLNFSDWRVIIGGMLFFSLWVRENILNAYRQDFVERCGLTK